MREARDAEAATVDRTARHPMQPLVVIDDRVRFKANRIVRHLLDHGGINLNQILIGQFSQEDLDQFYQLIGYSVDGFAELSPYGDNAVISEEGATAAVHEMCKQFGTAFSRCLDEDGCPIHRRAETVIA